MVIARSRACDVVIPMERILRIEAKNEKNEIVMLTASVDWEGNISRIKSPLRVLTEKDRESRKIQEAIP